MSKLILIMFKYGLEKLKKIAITQKIHTKKCFLKNSVFFKELKNGKLKLKKQIALSYNKINNFIVCFIYHKPNK